MFAGMDVVGVDIAPERNDFSANSIFFIMWMIVGSFVALNLFVGMRASFFSTSPMATLASPHAPPHAPPRILLLPTPLLVYFSSTPLLVYFSSTPPLSSLLPQA